MTHFKNYFLNVFLKCLQDDKVKNCQESVKQESDDDCNNNNNNNIRSRSEGKEAEKFPHLRLEMLVCIC